MKFNRKVLIINGVTLLILGIFGIVSGGAAGLGLAVLGLAIINIPMALVLAIMKKNDAFKTCLICMGVLFLAGFSICSQSTFNMH